MIDVIILALALSMDAFAVAIGLGSKRLKQTSSLAIITGIYFGIFQGAMPLVGYLAGKGLLGWLSHYTPWVAFILLTLIGAKMIYESMTTGIEQDITKISHKIMLMLAIATSVDAMAAGFSLNLLTVNVFIAAAIIAFTTFSASAIGVFIGAKSGTWLEHKAELLGGIVLIVIGLKLLLISS
ncbi:manganese efflux pump MntP family protein [Litorilituus sediminis]|uniref:Putative manganese efflux pump MntP n=1 Tax=Litorilituus sediminis TaxID=718192 RepID=A0A4P6P791_9GAMM|nr:manganese efflux pump MntP family protein [Litorilituus sediminis]QBG36918.1 manganese efflux pump [Litorilituus sediminis]